MANHFGTDILIQAEDQKTRRSSTSGKLEVTVDSIEDVQRRLVANGCEIVKNEPDFPRCYIKDPFGLIYNLTS